MLPNYDTITALATAPGKAAIAVIRISGKEAFPVIEKIFRKKNKPVCFTQIDSHTVHLGTLVDADTIIDEVLITAFKSPNSFTGEDIIEISCHGSPFIIQKIIKLLLNNGIRTANPGEFTLRAFLNGKMDLSQAEAVADLIASSSEAAHQLALNQMKGGVSKAIGLLRDELIGFASLIELELDFSEEDIEFADRKQLELTIERTLNRIQMLIHSFETGNAIRNGIPVVIAGRPNSGKSTLLNNLLQDERAIVSPIAGTTRDTIEEEMIFDGIRFRFIDTAGIRHAKDEIEKIGVERTLEKIKQARIVIYLFDMNEMTVDEVEHEIQSLKSSASAHTEFITCANKSDLVSEDIKKKFQSLNGLFISAKYEKGIEELKRKLSEPFLLGIKEAGPLVITNSRHYEALIQTKASLEAALQGLKDHRSHDLIAADLRHALNQLGLIAGTITTENLLDHIFSHFCIGK
ncbi:MAG: tRNA uridine-5-carboxymethylaminomethyl(34) synthesis GTPase MnmE [Bacteroidia bacterium]|nr:tRNA uridine-5-carboxymethylaminomethyl(34) synthesis GTPase MnmE [Bacteroidia bacterium]